MDIYKDSGGVVVPYPYTIAATKSATGETIYYTGYRVALNYDLQMLENLKFTQELNMRGDFDESDNYFVYSKSGLSSKIADNLSAGVSYVVDYVNMPDPDKENSDRTFTATLIIDY